MTETTLTPQAGITSLSSNQEVQLPFGQLVPSPLNPRKHFDEEKIVELAANIKAKGLLQNLIVRSHPIQTDLFELVAGERRYRALKVLVEAGDLDPETPVRCLLTEISDREVLEIATAENFARADMTPLEECEAFSKLVELGADIPSISLRFGKGEKNITRKIQIARNLIPVWKKELDQGLITLAFAEALCLASPDTQQHIKGNQYYYRGNPDAVRTYISEGKVLVKYAKFELSLYNGNVTEDLFGEIEPFFNDKQQALNLQVAWGKAQVEKLRKKNKKHDFVDFVESDGHYYPDNTQYRWSPSEHEQKPGLLYILNTRTGEITERTDLYRVIKPAASTAEISSEDQAAARDPYNKAAHLIGHQMRAIAYRRFIASDPRQAVIHVIMGLLENYYEGTVRLNTSDTHHLDIGLEEQYLQASHVLDVELRNNTKLNAGRLSGEYFTGGKGIQLYDRLNAMSLDELLNLLALQVAPLCADWPNADEKAKPNPILLHVAKVNCLSVFEHFTFTETFLKACSTAKLSELAEEAGVAANMGLALTKKEKVQKLLDMAPKLHEQGYYPTLVGFDGDA